MDKKEHFMHLQYSESIVARMSADILSAFIQAGVLTADNEDDMVTRAVGLAIKLANQTEEHIKSDQEWVKKESKADPWL